MLYFEAGVVIVKSKTEKKNHQKKLEQDNENGNLMHSPHVGLKIINKLILLGDFVVKIHKVDVGRSF